MRSKYRASNTLSASGSSVSPSSVEPVTSQKSTVTTLRCSRPGAGIAATAAPQNGQKRNSPGSSLPQPGHDLTAPSLGSSSGDGGRGERGEPSVPQRQAPRGPTGEIGVVRRDDHGRAVLCGEPGEEVDDLAAGSSVEVPGRLVREHDSRLHGERTGDRDALLLAAGQVPRQVVRSAGEADLVEELQRPFATAAHRGELHLDVLDGCQRRDQVELLEDEPEGAQAQLGQLPVAQRGEIAVFEDDVAGARPVERAEELQKRRLAGAARPFERDELARLELEIDAVERTDGGRSALEELRDAAQHVLGRHQSTCLNASAGRRRAARMAPAVPATKPPRRASPNPVARTVTPTGALSDTELVAVRAVDAPRPKSDELPVVELALSVGPKALIAITSATPSPRPSSVRIVRVRRRR